MNDNINALLEDFDNYKNILKGYIDMLPDGLIKNKFNELFAKIQTGDIDIEYFKKEVEEIKKYASRNKNIKSEVL